MQSKHVPNLLVSDVQYHLKFVIFEKSIPSTLTCGWVDRRFVDVRNNSSSAVVILNPFISIFENFMKLIDFPVVEQRCKEYVDL